MKQFKTLLLLLALFGGLLYASGYSDETHKCRWGLCPYTGVSVNDRREAIIEYTEQEDTDAYYIDDLHFLNPSLEYDQLDSLLFASGYNKNK